MCVTCEKIKLKQKLVYLLRGVILEQVQTLLSSLFEPQQMENVCVVCSKLLSGYAKGLWFEQIHIESKFQVQKQTFHSFAPVHPYRHVQTSGIDEIIFNQITSETSQKSTIHIAKGTQTSIKSS